MKRKVWFVALLATGAVLGVPGQAPAAEPIHRTLSADVALGVPAAGRIVEARLPWRANMIGVAFPGVPRDADLEIELRAHTGRGWSAWTPLESGSEDAPDGAEAARANPHATTDPVWVGAVRRAQVRVLTPDPRLRAVKIIALNTAGDAYEVSLPVRLWRGLARFLSMQPQRAEAMTSTPKIISRAQWGGSSYTRQPSGVGIASEVKMVFLHHTDNPNGYAKSQSAAIVRGIHRFHTSNRGFSDIGYNFLIDRYGQIFEGRWGGATKPVIGAHTMGFNRYSTGISLIGTYSSLTPPTPMQTSLKRLLAWKMDVHHIPVQGTVLMTSAGNERYDAGEVVRFDRVSGHRNAKPTACPGARAYNLLPSFRRGADALGHPKIILPSLWTKSGTNTLRLDGDGIDEGVRFRASFTRSVAWTLTISGSSTKTFTGTGTSLNVPWIPREDPALPETGRYTWTIAARAGSAVARSATGLLYIVTDHPVGTLLRDASGYYVVGADPTRQDAATVARLSVFGGYRAITTGPGERARFPVATPLAMRDGTLLVGPDGTRYIFSGGTLRRFVTDPADAFAALGYSSAALIPADDATLAALPVGAPVEDVTRHPDGTVIRDPAAANETWVIEAGILRPIDALALASRYRAAEVVTAVAGDLALTRSLQPFDLREGVVLRGPGDVSYVYTGGVLRRFVDNILYVRMGYSWAMRLPATAAQIEALPAGPVLG